MYDSKILSFFRRKDKKLNDNRWVFSSMLIGSLLSLLASFMLSVEAFELASNPDAVLSCSINSVLNCATVAKHPSAFLFGFPNSFLGLMAEPVVITVAIAGLFGMRFPKLFMFIAQIGYTLGFIFAYYLFYVSFFIIQTLCPWCLLVTLTTTLVFFSITRYNIRDGNLYLSDNISKRLQILIKKDYDRLLLASIIVVVIAAILIKYGDGIIS